MGNAVRKPKAIDHEFDYRYENTRNLRSSLKGLVKSIGETNVTFFNVPTRMVDAGESFIALNACMNHSGAGGASQVTGSRQQQHNDNSNNNSSGGGGSREQSPAPHPRIDRQQAQEAYDSAQAFAESMRRLKEEQYPAYRNRIEADVVRKAGELIAKADSVLVLAKRAATTADSHAAAAAKVDDIQKKCAKKGKEPTSHGKYDAAVRRRNAAEASATEDKNTFHDAYETLLAAAQVFSQDAMNAYLDHTVAFNKELVRILDTTGTPTGGSVVRTDPSREPTARHGDGFE